MSTDVEYMPDGTKADTFSQRLWKLGPWLNLLTTPEGKVTGNKEQVQNESAVKQPSYRIPLWLVLLVGVLVGICLMTIVFVPLYTLKDVSATNNNNDNDDASSPGGTTQTILVIPGTASGRGVTYTDELSDTSSDSFQKIAQDFCAGIEEKLLSSDVGDFFRSCTVTSIGTDSTIQFRVDIVKLDGVTAEGLHHNVTDALQGEPQAAPHKTKSSGKTDTYSVNVAPFSSVQTKAVTCGVPCFHGSCNDQVTPNKCACSDGWGGADCSQRCEGDWVAPTGFTPDLNPVYYDTFDNTNCYDLYRPNTDANNDPGWDANPILPLDGKTTNAFAVSITDSDPDTQPCFQKGTQTCNDGLSIVASVKFVTPDVPGNLVIATVSEQRGGFTVEYDGPTNQIKVSYRTGSGGLSKSVAFPDNIDGWFHLAAVIDPTNNDIAIYVNGQSQGGTTSVTTDPFTGAVDGRVYFRTNDDGQTDRRAEYMVDNFVIIEDIMSATDVQLLSANDPCESGPCKNSGTCTSNGLTFSCTCPPDYTGADCSTPVTCPDPVITNAAINTADIRNPYKYNNVVNIRCKAGHVLESGSLKLTCTSEGTWDNTPPTCVTCPPLDPVPHSTYEGGVTWVIYTCDEGYELDEDGGARSRLCYNNNGVVQWTGEQPECTLKNCLAPPVVPNAGIVEGQQATYSIGDTIRYECDAGYVTDDDLTRTCGTQGWSPAPLCTDPCDTVTCENGGTCVGNNPALNRTCNCPDEFTGQHCKTEIPTCEKNNPCENNGICEGLIPGTLELSCNCENTGYGGPHCTEDPCDAITCENGGTCVANNPALNRTCNCPDGFTGQHCETELPTCEKNNPCVNNGTCDGLIPGTLELHCNCADTGFTGDHCTEDIDECANTQTPPCGDQICENLPGGYECRCKEGFSGTAPAACTNINECEEGNVCGQFTVCNDTVGGYDCYCDPGYKEQWVGDARDPNKGCIDINECDENSASCDLQNSRCANEQGTYRCDCNEGYKKIPDTQTCEDITCDRIDIQHGSVAPDQATFDYLKSATYSCDAGYELVGAASITCNGDNNEWSGPAPQCTEINECDADPCGDNANCTDLVNDFECTCLEGFTGDANTGCTSLTECETAADCGVRTDCVDNVCQCKNTSVEAFAGDAKGTARGCQDKNECDGSNGCDAGSTVCVNEDPRYRCDCKDGYTRVTDMACEEITCAKPDTTTFNTTIASGSEDKAQYSLGENILYRCDEGYIILAGMEFITCEEQGSNGQWNDDPLQCELNEPCNPSPCGANTDCNQVGDIFMCVCQEGYTAASTDGQFTAGFTCDLCDVGYGKVGNACEPCEIGFYKASPVFEACTVCPNSRTTENTGTTSQDLCLCAAGKYEPNPTSVDWECLDCPLGSYSEEPGAVGSCTECQGTNVTTDSTGSTSASQCVCGEGLGLIGESENQVCGVCNNGYYADNDVCVSCGQNTNSLMPRDSVSNCQCKLGYDTSPPSCVECGEGRYRDSDSATCQDCSDGPGVKVTTPTNNATTSDDCECKPGYAGDPKTECVICGVGFFSLGNQATCTPCGDGATTDGEGSTSFSACTCLAGYYGGSTAGGCTRCPDGTHSTAGAALRVSDCTPCGDFTTTGGQGGTAISDCQCIAGYAGTPNTEGGVCTVCTSGTYSDVGQETCDSCGDNTVTDPVEGATNLTDCKCNAGYEGSPGSCTICTDGSYSENPGDSCVSCGPSATTNGDGATSKSQCSCLAGSVGDPAADDTCAACPDGQYATAGAISCSPCGNSMTTGGEGQGTSADSCRCIAGYAMTNGQCMQCQAGQFAVEGSDACSPCPDGTTSEAGATSEADCYCPKGWFIDTNDSDRCKICVEDTYNNITDFRAADSCPACENGATTGGQDGATVCGCAEGMYLDTGSGSCTNCPAGTYKGENGDAQSLCLDCPGDAANVTTVDTGSTQLSQCVCAAGFQGTGSTGSCTDCPDGYYKADPADGDCTQAPADSTVNAERTGYTCNAGYNESASGTCDQCPAGYYGTDGTSCTKCSTDESLTTNFPSVATAAADCECSAGYGTADGDSAQCTQCAGSTFKSTSGNIQCPSVPAFSTPVNSFTAFACDAGYFSTDVEGTTDSSTCDPCAQNTYKTGQGNSVDECLDCPNGGTTTGTGSITLGACSGGG